VILSACITPVAQGHQRFLIWDKTGMEGTTDSTTGEAPTKIANQIPNRFNLSIASL
jgi:hypothetical protein